MDKNMQKIPLVDLKAQYTTIKPEINSAIKRVLAQADFIMGDVIDQFEKSFARFVNARYAIGVSSGTDAIHLALIALGITKGDEVITTAHTFTATAEPIVWLGAKPVFADIDPHSFTVDPNKIENLITRKTRVIMPVHIYGQSADMDPILKLAKKYKLFVLEDAAQAHGAKYKDKRVGAIGDIGIFSFYPGKNLGAYGDAGLIVTNNNKLAEKIFLLRNHGRTTKYEHLEVGYGDRLDTLQAAILQAKLPFLSKWNAQRRAHAALYQKLLNNNSKIVLPTISAYAEHVFHLFVVRVPKRDEVAMLLKQKGISSGVHYPLPLHLQPAYSYLKYKKGDLSETEKASREILSLPLYPELTAKQIDFICNTLIKIIDKLK